MTDTPVRVAATIPALRAWLDERLLVAREDEYISRKVAPNSYGHGYNHCRVETLEEILCLLDDGIL
jgi:hypothetical protein